jgi:hypothetical protein
MIYATDAEGRPIDIENQIKTLEAEIEIATRNIQGWEDKMNNFVSTCPDQLNPVRRDLLELRNETAGPANTWAAHQDLLSRTGEPMAKLYISAHRERTRLVELRVGLATLQQYRPQKATTTFKNGFLDAFVGCRTREDVAGMDTQMLLEATHLQDPLPSELYPQIKMFADWDIRTCAELARRLVEIKWEYLKAVQAA